MPTTVIRSLMSAVPMPMLLLDRAGTIAAANPGAEALLGQWITGHSHISVLRQPGLLNGIETAYATREAGKARYVVTDRTGETVFRVCLTPIGGEEAGDGGLILHFEDITHLREAEEMRRDFVANVSHELRTPLTAIMGFIETLRGPAQDDAEAQARFLGIMADEAQRMNRMVADLLSLSRVEGQERMRPADPVDLTDLLDGVAAALLPQAEEAGNTLTVEAPGPRITLAGDADQLTQVFLNLTENALKYGGPDRPVIIRATEDEGIGGIRGPVVRVDVIDRGEGIDPVHLPRLTERFYRVDTHRSRAMGGTGLGLAIVKHIVNRHRGRLKISSEAGQGSSFSVILPKG